MQVSRGQSTPISSIPDDKYIKIYRRNGLAESTDVANLHYRVFLVKLSESKLVRQQWKRDKYGIWSRETIGYWPSTVVQVVRKKALKAKTKNDQI